MMIDSSRFCFCEYLYANLANEFRMLSECCVIIVGLDLDDALDRIGTLRYYYP